MSRRNLALALAVLVAGLSVAVISGQGIVIPNTFVTRTAANPNEVNANFTALSNGALNRAGGTMTGTLNVHTILPTADTTYDLGDASHRVRHGYFDTVEASTFTGTTATLTLLGQASGTDATAAATNLYTLPISGLTANDRLRILITHSSAAQLTNAPVLYSTTDAAVIKGLCNNGNLAAGDYCTDEVTLTSDHSSAKKVVAFDVGFVGVGGAVGHNTGVLWTAVTDFTGSWTLALRTGAGGVVAGGTYSYTMSVFKWAGQ